MVVLQGLLFPLSPFVGTLQTALPQGVWNRCITSILPPLANLTTVMLLPRVITLCPVRALLISPMALLRMATTWLPKTLPDLLARLKQLSVTDLILVTPLVTKLVFVLTNLNPELQF